MLSFTIFGIVAPRSSSTASCALSLLNAPYFGPFGTYLDPRIPASPVLAWYCLQVTSSIVIIGSIIRA